MARLGDYIKQIRGVSYKPEDLHPYLDENSITLLRANNIQEGKLVLDDVVFVDKARVREEQVLRKGDILVCTSSGSKDLVGKAALVTADAQITFGAFCKVVRPISGDPYYFGLFFDSPIYRKKISDASAGANINNIRSEHIDELEISMPGEREQADAVSVLSVINSLISLRKKQLQKLDDLVKSRFVEMFGDSVANPKGWKKEALSKNATLLNGRAYKQDELLDKGKYPVLRVGNFFSNRGWYYSDLELEDDKYCDNGDLLYAWSASFGPRIWNGEKVIYHYHIWKVLVGDSYNKLFLCKLLEHATESLMGETHGIAMMHLTKSGMEQTEFIVPPITLQKQFAEFYTQVNESKLTVHQGLDKLELLKQSLMQKYFE